MTPAPHRPSLAVRIGSFVFGLYTVGVVLLVGVPAAALAVAFCPTRRSAWRLLRRGLRLAGALTGLGPDLRIAPGAALPAGPFVAVSNHASLLDVLALIAALEEPVAFTAKREVFEWPLVGRFAGRIGAIPVERGSLRRRADALRAAAAALAAGRPVHVFPESTFSPAAGLLPFRLGAFRLARAQALPMVPIAVAGTRRTLRPGSRLPHPGRIEVRVLPPMAPPSGPDSRALAAFRDRVRRVLADELGEPLLDPARPMPP